VEYLFGELIGNLLAGLFMGRPFVRRTTARDKVLHAVRLSRRRNLTGEQHAFAARWLTIGSRHIDWFRLGRHQRRISAGLGRLRNVTDSGA
jgi:hypothetical protein